VSNLAGILNQGLRIPPIEGILTIFDNIILKFIYKRIFDHIKLKFYFEKKLLHRVTIMEKEFI